MSDLLARHRAVIPNWVTLYYDEPIEIVSGKGSRVTDAEGTTYLDFFAGIVTNTLGYDVAEVREAVERQLAHRGGAHLDALPPARPGRAGREDRPAVGHRGRQGVLHQLRHRGQRDGAAAGDVHAQEQPGARDAAELPRPLVRHDLDHRQPPRGRTARCRRSACTSCTAATGTSRSSAGCPTRTTSTSASTTCGTPSPPSSAGDVAAIIAEPIQGVGGYTCPPDGLYAAYQEVLAERGHPVHRRRGADRLGPYRPELLGHPEPRRDARHDHLRQGARQRLRHRRRRRARRAAGRPARHRPVDLRRQPDLHGRGQRHARLHPRPRPAGQRRQGSAAGSSRA